jgi:hypothetical protein
MAEVPNRVHGYMHESAWPISGRQAAGDINIICVLVVEVFAARMINSASPAWYNRFLAIYPLDDLGDTSDGLPVGMEFDPLMGNISGTVTRVI